MGDIDDSTARPAPDSLRCNGARAPLAIGPDAPLFSWSVEGRQTAARVRVEHSNGTLLSDSGMVPTSVPELRYAGPPLTSRLRLRWRVQIWAAPGAMSPWSDWAVCETALLDPEDWRASWIGRAVPPEVRPHRAVRGTGIEWISSGEVLEQPVPLPSGTSLIVADLRERDGVSFQARLELLSDNGEMLAAADILKELVPLDHFARFLNIDHQLPVQTGVLRLSVLAGEVGWLSEVLDTPDDDDGVSPIRIRRSHRRNRAEQPSVLSVGVEVPSAPDPVFRTSFTLDGEPRSARLYATGLGYGRFAVNGRPVSDSVLEPAQTDYDRRVLYAAHDVTDFLRAGANELSVALGRGFWSVRGGDTWGWHLAPWQREPQLLAQLEVQDDDGRSDTVVSNGSWETRASEIVEDRLYTGVTYDHGANDEGGWESATVVAPPAGVLVSSSMEPVRQAALLFPVAVRTTARGAEVYDFGTVLTGRIRCRISASAPGQLTFRYGEVLDADSAVLCVNPLAAPSTQVDRVMVRTPATPFEWEPEFSYKGFRYIEVETAGGALADDVRAVPLHNDVRSVGSFACENDVLTWIDSALARTFLNNLQNVPTDTPSYEKNGWTADAHLGLSGALHHFELRRVMSKWMDDHEDAQRPDGGIPQIIPTPGWGTKTDPAWSASAVLIPWDLFWEYGDEYELAKRLPMMSRYVEHALRRVEADGWIWRAHGWGDWLSPGNALAPEGAPPTSTMMLYRTVRRLADACRALGKEDDAQCHEVAAARLARAYHAEYFNASAGHYGPSAASYRQAMNVLPLAFEAVPPEHIAEVFASLERDLAERTGGHLDLGAAGVKQLLPVLDDHGRSDLAIGVATQPTRPGWAVWRRFGDTLWESWDPAARSRNHYFLGSVAAWIQQRVGGLRAGAPGWESIDVAPVLDDRITWARTHHDTVRGRASVDWSRSGDQWRFSIVVPAGVQATVRVPGVADRELGAGTHEFALDGEMATE